MINYDDFEKAGLSPDERVTQIIHLLKERPMTINELMIELNETHSHIASSLLRIRKKMNLITKKRFGVLTYFGLKDTARFIGEHEK